MTLEETFNLVNNLDVREPLRKLSPQWSTIAVDKAGKIIDVIRHKEQPTLQLNKEHLLKHPNSVQITAWPGRFNSIEELAKAVEECVWAHKNY
jgi:hypothetical protein